MPLLPLLFIALTLVGSTQEESLVAMGRLEWDRVELVAETNEPIVELVAREGQTLAANDIILRQDARRIQAQLDEAKASPWPRSSPAWQS